MSLSKYDVENIHAIMAGEGTWFSAHLLRLIAKADPVNRARLRAAFPNHVALCEWYWDHGPAAPAPIELVENGAKPVRATTGRKYQFDPMSLRVMDDRDGQWYSLQEAIERGLVVSP